MVTLKVLEEFLFTLFSTHLVLSTLVTFAPLVPKPHRAARHAV